MKKLLLIITFFISTNLFAQTSVYHQMPDSDAIWNYHFYADCQGLGIADEYYSLTITGDTLINGQVYQQLNNPYVLSFSTGLCGGLVAEYKGAYREDTVAKKVYFIQAFNTTEELLYDFNLQVGDTVQGYLEAFATDPDTVQTIDSVLVGGNYRKRWNINSCYDISIIEGIGSTYGFYQFSPGCDPDFPNYVLDCFIQDGSSIYPSASSSCDLITGIKSTESISSKINVYPNPSQGFLNISVDPNFEIKDLRLFDITGNDVWHQQVFNRQTITLDNLAGGVYILTATDRMNRKVNKKIIVCPN